MRCVQRAPFCCINGSQWSETGSDCARAGRPRRRARQLYTTPIDVQTQRVIFFNAGSTDPVNSCYTWYTLPGLPPRNIRAPLAHLYVF